ncbi:DNA-directed RNA polymerase subunit P [Candidatus Micrarchaeota archaeon]|nr:MAG: DNA-directed RNA polymerase subunit P [Candidatus Micrarchaeota archaeon]
MYTCWKCEEEIPELDPSFIRCPKCGSRILFKKRQPITRDIKTD